MAAAPMGFAGAFSGDYSSVDCSGCGSNNIWGINGSGAFGFGSSQVGAQIDGGYHRFSGDIGNANIWTVGGSVFWGPQWGRVGGTLGYASADCGSGCQINTFTYGPFVEGYLGNYVTLGAHGGGFSVDAFSTTNTGTYIGGGITGYAIPDLALSGTIDYSSINSFNATTYGVGAEWLVSRMVPISIFGGYRNTQLSGGGGHIDQWFVGARFYVGAPGMSLVDHNRNGTLGWVGNGLGSPLSAVQFAF